MVPRPSDASRPGRAPLAVRAGLALVVAAACAAGWRLRWVLDDAFISFRYAHNAVLGHGLVFNPGESPPVEGYTNFLWTAIATLPIALGRDPVLPMLALGVALCAATLLATFALARRCAERPAHALLATALVASSYTFLCFATSGLETMLQCALVTGAFALAAGLDARAPAAWRLVAVSLCGAGALLTRLDSAVPGAVLAAWLAWRLRGADARGLAAARLLAPAAALVGAWLAWTLAFYGELLPNTWYAREAGLALATRAARGLRYLGGFALDYGVAPALVLVAWVPRAARTPRQALLVATVLAWAAYVVHAGGDYMEYRFAVPVLPLLTTALVVAAAALGRAANVALAALAVALVAGSVTHGLRNDGSPIGEGRLAPADPRAPAEPFRTHWEAVRRTVERYAGSERWRWTLPALGAAGYYTRFHLVDLHGLTDRAIAREGRVADIGPAHDKYASLATLRARGVTFANSFGDPCHYRQFFGAELDGAALHQVAFDLGEGRRTAMLLLYLTPDPAADRLLAERGRRVALPSAAQCAAERRARGEHWIAPGEPAREAD
ncbi:MAG: hypothetical protein R3E88_02525 [Myxococcota bacterium]